MRYYDGRKNCTTTFYESYNHPNAVQMNFKFDKLLSLFLSINKIHKFGISKIMKIIYHQSFTKKLRNNIFKTTVTKEKDEY